MKLRRYTLFGLLTAMLVVAMLSALAVGSARLDLASLFRGLAGCEGYEREGVILAAIRLPRMLAALIAGVGLSLSGTILQAVMGNPLASPNIIGVNAGAGFAVILCLNLFPRAIHAMPFAAFAGAFFAAMVILALARRIGRSRTTVVLAGVACTTLFQAGISFLTTLDADVLSAYNAFSVGGFAGVSMERLAVPGAIVALCLVAALSVSGRISALSLGDAMAASLGVRVGRVRTLCLLIASASAAAVVSYAGLLGFVGLVVPHIARRFTGADVRNQLKIAPLIGGILVIFSDMIGRTLFAPTEISVGVIMAFIGAPFFFVLLLRERRKMDA